MEWILLAALLGQPAEGIKSATPPEWTPREAIFAAAANMEEIDNDRAAEYIRYVYFARGTVEEHWLSSLALNLSVSELSNPETVQPLVFGDGHMERLSLLDFAPSNPSRLAELWDRMFDEYSQVRADKIVSPPIVIEVTKDVNAMSADAVSFKVSAGTRFTVTKIEERTGWVKVSDGGKVGWVRQDAVRQVAVPAGPVAGAKDAKTAVFSDAFGPDVVTAGEYLQLRTRCVAPIVRAEEFILRHALSSNSKDRGLYLDFTGIENDYDAFLKQVGADDAVTVRLKSRRRLGQLWSDVTRAPRAHEIDPILGAPVDTPRVNWATEDNGKEDRGVDRHPLRNIDGHDFAASEVFTSRKNGGLLFSLWAVVKDASGKPQRNAAGNLKRERQDVVPDSIAGNDKTTPDDRRLFSPIDCLLCHQKDKHDMWRTFRNDTRRLVQTKQVIFDRATGGKSLEEFQSDARGLYDWDHYPLIVRLRSDWREFLAKCCGTREVEKDGTKKLVSPEPDEIGSALRAMQQAYMEAPVTPLVAVRELGLPPAASDADAALLLRKSIAPIESGIEDPVIFSLFDADTRITREDWRQVYQETYRRVPRGRIVPRLPPAPEAELK